MFVKSKKYLKRFGSDLWNALPVILFFLVLFYCVIFLFGTSYLLLVSVCTTIFKVNYQKRFTLKGILIIIAEQLLMCVLAFLATRNLPLCIILNAMVPFILVVLRTTRFNQKGYFVNAMGFVFLQLRPVSFAGFGKQILVYAILLIFLAAALGIVTVLKGKHREYLAVREGFGIAAKRFRSLASGERIKDISLQMASVQNSFHAGAAASQHPDTNGSIPYIFALLFQRTAYFILDYLQLEEKFSNADVRLFGKMADYMEEIKISLNSKDNEALIQRAGELSNETDDVSERLQTYMGNFLHLLVMALTLITSKEQKTVHYTANWKRFWKEKKARLRPEQFEMRFALRLSLVLSLSFLICRLLDISHSYWLPLNAFLLVQPMYEESTRRLKNRVIGTFLGSTFVFFVLMNLNGMTAHFILAAVMVSFMYSFVPGSILQVFFSTGFALTLTTLSLNSTTAVELRLIYVITAVVFVLLANRFCFPTSLYGQFRFNLREVIHMEYSYLDFLNIGSLRPIDYEIMSDALAQFNLTYGQAMEYLTKHPSAEMECYRSLLNTLWRMVSEIEQMVFYVTTENTGPKEREMVQKFVRQMKDALKPHSTWKTETEVKGCNPYLERLMTKYIVNVEKMQEMYNRFPDLEGLFAK